MEVARLQWDLLPRWARDDCFLTKPVRNLQCNNVSIAVPRLTSQKVVTPFHNVVRYSLESTVAVVLQFMDELQEQGGGGAAAAAAAAPPGTATAAAAASAGGRWAMAQADLALGAVRLLGR
jgi:hypothetical protein